MYIQISHYKRYFTRYIWLNFDLNDLEFKLEKINNEFYTLIVTVKNRSEFYHIVDIHKDLINKPPFKNIAVELKKFIMKHSSESNIKTIGLINI